MKYLYCILILISCTNNAKNSENSIGKLPIKTDSIRNENIYNPSESIDSIEEDLVERKPSIIKVKSDSIEKFDYKKYKENKIGNLARFILEDSSILELSESDDFYKEVKKKKNYAIESYRVFYKSTKTIISEGFLFNGRFPIGFLKKYNKDGELINYVNYDDDYKFTINDVASFVKSKYKIDILNPETNCTMTRTRKSPFKYYISFPFKNSQTSIYVLRINGNTGELISEEIKSMEE